MTTPTKKEFGPGYDYPNRKLNFWSVILPAVLVAALAVVLMRHTGSAGSQVTRSPIVTCPTQTCPPTGSADSATPTSRSTATRTSPSSSPTGSSATHAVVLSSA